MAEGNMAVWVTAMGSILVQGRQVTAVAVAECCSTKEYPADHRSCVLVAISPFVAGGSSTSGAAAALDEEEAFGE